MANLRPFLDAARIDRALLAPCAVFVGSSYAHFDAQPGPGFPAHVVVSLAALAAGIGVGFVDHAWDRLGAPLPDARKAGPEEEVPLDSRDAAIAGAIALGAALALGLVLIPLSGPAALGWGVLAVLCGLPRGAPVAGLDTLGRGLGDVATGFALGPLAALAGYASQAGYGGFGAVLVGIPPGLIAVAALFVRHFERPEADARLARATPLATLGAEKARMLLVALPVFAGAGIAAIVETGEYKTAAMAAAAPLAVQAFLAWRVPAGAAPETWRRYDRIAVALAILSLLALAAAIRLATPGA